MSDHEPPPRPADFRTTMEGHGGLVLVTIVGGPRDGHELYMDELEVPDEIWTTSRGRFEWWPSRVREEMSRTAVGGDPDAPPAHYVLRVPEETREPIYELAPGD